MTVFKLKMLLREFKLGLAFEWRSCFVDCRFGQNLDIDWRVKNEIITIMKVGGTESF